MRLLLLFVTLLLVACAATKSSMPEKAVVLTKQDKDKMLNVAVGESFVITLDENPTTGYVWAVEEQPESLVLQSSDYVSDVHPNQLGAPMIVGVGGKRTFTFVAHKSGTTTLKLKHWRPWEGDASIVDTFSVPVVVR
ncbi:MAG: protease inhibitor I42 family protein [Methylococcales bacterium]|nr:protease inhibitor I42 family protein [Methylococcales bacterium]